MKCNGIEFTTPEECLEILRDGGKCVDRIKDGKYYIDIYVFMEYDFPNRDDFLLQEIKDTMDKLRRANEKPTQPR